MSDNYENPASDPAVEGEDVEAHLRIAIDGPDTDDDVAAHGFRNPTLVEDDDDVEGHMQPPRGDDTDRMHSIRLS